MAGILTMAVLTITMTVLWLYSPSWSQVCILTMTVLTVTVLWLYYGCAHHGAVLVADGRRVLADLEPALVRALN